MSATPTPPKPQPIAEKPNNSKRDKEGQDDEQHPNTPPEDQGDNVKRGDPPGGGGGPAPRPPLTPQWVTTPTQTSQIGRVKIKAPDVFNGDQKRTQIFLNQLYLVFKGDPDKYQTDDAKIATVMSYIKGPNIT